MAPGLQLYDTGRGKNEARRIAPNRCRRYNRTSSKPRKRKPDEEIVEVSVPVLGAIPGIGLAVAIAIIEFLWDGWRPHSAVLGRAEGVKGYHDITRYPNARQIPGLVLFRWDAPLFFANAEFFKERILDAVTKSPSPVRRVVVAAEPVTSVDVTAADMLTDLAKTLLNAGIELHFAELKDPVKDKLKRFGLFAIFVEDKFFPTIGGAVALYLKSHDVP